MSIQEPPLPGSQDWPTPTQTIRDQFNLASYGQRLLARIIDVVIMAAVTIPIFLSIDSGLTLIATLEGFMLAYSILNDVVLTTVKGGTIGKLIVGTRVVQLEDRQPVRAGAAFKRWVTMLVFNFLPVVGIIDPIWIFTGRMRQTLHDKIVETIVVKAPV
jgi:uncharacterized RDD family membrane protein YckC